jgi:hypothetical protein
MSMSNTSTKKQRDPLLDLWRGLALVDMAWVHLVAYPIGVASVLALWIGEYTRFAAGAFVLISGLSVARVFGPRLAGDPAQVRETRRRLFRRALMLLVLDRLVAVAFGLIERSLSVPPTITPRYPDLFDLLTFATPGVTGGLLSLYAVLLVATPLIDWTLRRHGPLGALAASAGLYALAHGGFLGSPGANWPFPVAYWQPLFVVGYVVSHRLAALRNASGRIAVWWLTLVSTAFAALFLLRNGASIGQVALSALPALAFVKVPLSPWELAWYLSSSAFVLTWSAWVWERAAWARRLLGWLTLLGRQSLLVYVAHLFVQLVLIEVLTLLEPSTTARALMLPLMALVLVAVAAAGNRARFGRGPRPSLPLRLLPPRAFVGGSVMVGTLAAVVTLQLLFGTPAAWNLAPDAAEVEVATMSDENAAVLPAADGDPYLDAIPWLMELGDDGYPVPLVAPDAVDAEHIESGT